MRPDDDVPSAAELRAYDDSKMRWAEEVLPEHRVLALREGLPRCLLTVEQLRGGP
jgi:hypothetical protein